MKKYLLCISMTIIGLMNAQQENVGVGTTSPDESAIIEIQSTEKGMLPPRMTQSERDAIVNPANGLVLYNTTEGCLQINKGVKTAPLWECIGKSTIKNSSTWGSGVVEYGTPASCSAGLITGTMTVGSPLTNVNMLVYAKVVEAGTYEIATNPVNGIVFRGSGEFTASQVGQCIPVVLVGAGIPEQVGNFDFTLNTSPNETVSKNVEAVKIRFISVERYNGISPIYSVATLKKGVGYNNEAVPASSTIEILVETTGATTYNFTAQDETLDTGLVYSASGSFPLAGTYTVTLHNNGVVVGERKIGEMTMLLQGGSNTLELSPRIDYKTIPASQTQIVELNIVGDYDGDMNTSDTSKIWMDRDLGARNRPWALYVSSFFANSYQYGRGNDGHEINVVAEIDGDYYVQGLNGSTSTQLPSTTSSGYNQFVLDTPSSPRSWGQNTITNEWDGVSGVNNPCPQGYRLPTKQELRVFVNKISSNQFGNGFASLGWRFRNNGKRKSQGNPSETRWWGYKSNIPVLGDFSEEGGSVRDFPYPSHAHSVRCIKN